MVSILLEPGPDAEPIRERVESPGESLHVPHLLNILRRQTLRGILAEERGATVLQDLESIRMMRYAHVPRLERIWNLRGNLTAYGAAYIALAEALDAPLVTTDTRLAQARGNRVTVELYK